MEYRRLGRTGLRVSVLGLGTGGASQLGQTAGVAEDEIAKLLRRALDLGINLIDTAADYRESEAILGRTLRGVPREGYVLCTKFKAERRGPDGLTLKAPDAMAESLERSLQRLATDHVDVFQLHGIPPQLYAQVLERFVPVARRLQEQGKVRFFGATESFADDHEYEALRLCLQDDVFDTIMVGYNLLTPTPEEHVLPEAQRKDVGVLVMCAVRRAIARPAALEAVIADLKASGEVAPDALPDRDPLGWLAHDGTASTVSAAYKFAAGHPAVSCVLSGTADVHHLEQNVHDVLGPPLAAADRRRLVELFGPVRRKLGN